MDPERERIKDDLRGLVKGDVRCDDVFLQLYSSDASIYEIKPLAVVRPRNRTDVVATVQYAAENKLPIHARGAGSGLAGESLGPGIVLDFSRYMRRIIEVSGDTARIQPGVVHGRLNQYLKSWGKHFGPDPSTSGVTTMGSVISIDAGGSHWLKYGSARRHVLALEVVLADGEVIEASRCPLSGPHFDPQSRRGRLASELADVLSREVDLIAAHQPKTAVNCSGYQLSGVLGEGSVDLASLLVGSEGTLGLITEAIVAIQPLPKHRGVALLFFDRLESAAQAVLEIVPLAPSACDLMDRRHISLARENHPEYDRFVRQDAEAVLLVEYEGDSRAEVRDRLAALVDRVRRKKRLAIHAVQAQDAEEVSLYWRLAQKVTPTLFRVKGAARPLPFIEDMAVPPAKLADFLVRMQNVLKQHQVIASLFGHAGHGQLHLRPFMDLSNPADIARMSHLAADIYSEVIAVGGTISGEHADGLSRTQFIRQQYGPLVRVFHDVKRIFDPQNTLNPGKILNDDDELLTRNLRPMKTTAVNGAAESNAVVSGVTSNGETPATQRVPGEEGSQHNGHAEGADRSEVSAVGAAASAASAIGAVIANAAAAPPPTPPAPLELQLRWSVDEMAEAARNCNGCGGCRAQSSDLRMCPIFRLAPAEEASPRAKANLMRAVLSGPLDAASLSDDRFKEVADLCVNCHMCRLECPAAVDIPKLMVEAKAAYVRVNGLSKGDWVLSHIDLFSRLGSLIAPLANRALAARPMRWLIEKTLGIAQGRKLPRFAARSFIRHAARRRLTRPSRRGGAKVLYFVDTYANYHDPQLAEALVAVLEHNGISVYVHPGQLSSGMPLISFGVLPKAKQIAARNIAILAEAVRQGYHIVTTEPSAALALTHEYPSLIDDDDARLVAANSSEACSYLWRLHSEGKLRLDLKPVNATLGYHLPCHLKALGVGSPGEDLLRLVPGLIVERIEKGCSGMAGTFGLKRENYRASLRAGRGLIAAMRRPELQAGVTECSTCKIQMEQGTDKPTVHPLKILALAYGVMPDAVEALVARSQELVVT